MVSGFFFGQVLAVNTWSVVPDHSLGKILHVLWQTAAMCCMIAGLTAVVKDEWLSHDPSLTSMHSWIGVAGIVMFGKHYYSKFNLICFTINFNVYEILEIRFKLFLG